VRLDAAHDRAFGDFTMRVHEVFLSIQGEGVHTGMPTIFVRTRGCSLRCRWCDTPEARDGEGGEALTFLDLLARVKEYRTASRVCLTGGEPLEQPNSKMFIQLLLNERYAVDLETNGAHYLGDIPTHERLTISMDVKTPSSGMEGSVRLDNIDCLGPKDQLKFVIEDDADLDYAESVVAGHAPACPIVLTPVNGVALEPLLEKVLARRFWCGRPMRVLPQLHKLIWGDRKGV
jgi:7-carboxy-7-deazaguanine synthase